jgi:hypothetical protein
MAILCLPYLPNLATCSSLAASSANQSGTTCSHWTAKITLPYPYRLQARYRYRESVTLAPSSDPSCSCGEATPKTGSRTSKMRGSTCSTYVSPYLTFPGVKLIRSIALEDTREWTRIMALGSRPKGRYGHAVCMSGNTFYVSGGQVDGKFMNDLWGFDLSTCKIVVPGNDRCILFR